MAHDTPSGSDEFIDADKRDILAAAKFIPTEPFTKRSLPWHGLCAGCGRKTVARLTDMCRGRSACGYCAGNRVDPEEALQTMVSRGFQPLGPYPGKNSAPWPGNCLTCGRYGEPNWNNVGRKGQGPCGHCGGNRREVDEIISEALAAGFRPLEPYKNADTPWRGVCLTCNREISPRWSKISSRKNAQCKYCAGHYDDVSEAAQVMRDGGFEPLVPYPGAGEPWRCECLGCSRISAPRLVNVKRLGTGCGYCANKRVDPVDAVEQMRSRGFEPLVPYPGSVIPWESRCTSCERVSTPRHASRTTGCKFCAAYGFKLDREAWIYLMSRTGEQQFGVTNDLSTRVRTHQRDGWTVDDVVGPLQGQEAWDQERVLKALLRDNNIAIPGTTESWQTADLAVATLNDLLQRATAE